MRENEDDRTITEERHEEINVLIAKVADEIQRRADETVTTQEIQEESEKKISEIQKCRSRSAEDQMREKR